MKFRIWNEEAKCYIHEMGCNQHTRSDFYVGTDGNVLEVIVSENGSVNNYDTQFFDADQKKLVSKYKIESKLTITDRKGQELYEGDLIEAWNNISHEIIRGAIIYYPHNEAFRVHSKDGLHYDIFTLRDIQKIGDIHRSLEKL